MTKKSVLYFFTFFILSISVFAEKDPWDFQFDGRKWEVGFSHSPSASQCGIEYVLKGESVTNWSELVTSQFAGGLTGFTLDEWLKLFTEGMSKKYPSFKWKKIPMNDGSLLFEWSHKKGEWPAQHEIKRGIYIDNYVYFLSYAKKTEQLDKKTRAQWIEILKNAKLTSLKKAENKKKAQQLYNEALSLFQKGEKKKSVPLLLKAATLNNAQAQYHLGMMYLNGDGVKKDFKKSSKWFHKAANQNHAHAQCELGYAYYKGHGVKGDFATGFAWFMVSAENGSKKAMENCKNLRPLLKKEDLKKSIAIRLSIWEEIQKQANK